MKLSLMLLLTLFSCDNPTLTNSKLTTRFESTSKEFEKLRGVIEFDLLNLQKQQPLAIYNLDGSKFAEISYDTIKIGETKYSIKESDEKKLKTHIEARWFYPEYDILITDCVSETDSSYIIQLGSSRKYVKKNDNQLKYHTYPNFLENRSFQLHSDNPIREWPNDTSSIITNNDVVTTFQVVEFKGEWVRVSPDFELYGSSDFTGWVRWEKEEKLQITCVNFSY